MGRSSTEKRHRRRGLLVGCALGALGLLWAAGMFIVVMTWLSLGTHGYISLESLAANWEPVRVRYQLQVDFRGEIPGDFELLVPMPLIDGREIPEFTSSLSELSRPIEMVDTERGKFIRITKEYCGAYTGTYLSLGAKLGEAPRRGLASTHLAERFSLSGEQDGDKVWVYLAGNGEIVDGWIWVQLGNQVIGLASRHILIPKGPVEPGWRLLAEEITGG